MAKIVDKNIFLVVPKIIEQPTWGGDFILEAKGWQKKAPFTGLKIGQSYELYSGSRLRADLGSSADPDFTGELGYAMEPDNIIYDGNRMKLVDLADLIKPDPAGVLGKAGLRRGAGKLNLLIKFTQARDNSFQLHIGPKAKSKKWLSKPESWYYLKPGLVTLGLKPGANPDNFRKAVTAIDEELKDISEEVKNGALSPEKARHLSMSLVIKYDPWKFVNLLAVEADEVIDLSRGGLHHSWEDDPGRFPLGNVVYELQLDVMDPVSTIRCFDKGKFKADGSLRKLDIEDYFKYLNVSPAYNRPSKHRLKPKVVLENKSLRVESLMKSPYYCLDRLALDAEYSGKHAQTGSSFHHLFSKSGAVRIDCGNESLILTGGHSCFICARAGAYRISPHNLKKNHKIEILKTYIE